MLGDGDRRTSSFPDVFPISLTHNEYPTSYDVLESSGLPYGALVTPFIIREDDLNPDHIRLCTNALAIARCRQCSGYLNPFCAIVAGRWHCALCGHRNHFTKHDSRYTTSSDYDKLEETEVLISDFPMPFRVEDGVPNTELYAGNDKFIISSTERPLVHIFLIQESMPLDALQACIDCLDRVVKDMHPDIKIILLAYSNQLGVYKLIQIDSGNGFARDEAPPSAHMEGVISTAQQHFDKRRIHRIDISDNHGRGKSLAMYSKEGTSINNDKGKHSVFFGENGEQNPLRSAYPIDNNTSFLDTAKRVGDVQCVFYEALQTLYESNEAVTGKQQQQQQQQQPFGSDQMAESTGSIGGVQNAIAPALEGVLEWLSLEKSLRNANMYLNSTPSEVFSGLDLDDVDADGDSHIRGNDTASRGLWGLVSDLALGLVGPGGERKSESMDNVAIGSVPGGMRGTAPIQHCSGVILHVFVSNPQDIPLGYHESVKPPSSSSDMNTNYDQTKGAVGMNPLWAEEFATRAAHLNLGINIWAVASFDNQEIDLQGISPLAIHTGGTIHKISLGMFPRDERSRFTELLRRSLTSKPLATRGVFKMRASPCISILNESVSGHYMEDDRFPGVYRMPVCYPDSTLGFQIEYKQVDHYTQPEDRGNKVVYQVAYSYDTLVESPHLLPEKELSMETNTAVSNTAESVTTLTDTNEDIEGDVDINVDKEEEEESSFESYTNTLYTVLDVTTAHPDINASVSREANKHRRECRGVKESRMLMNKNFYSDNKSTLVQISHNRSKQFKDGDHRGAEGQMMDEHGQLINSSQEEKGKEESPVGILKMHSNQRRFKKEKKNKETYPEACYYDRDKQLIAVRKLRVVTMTVSITRSHARLVSSINPRTLMLLIVRQAIRDELNFRRYAATEDLLEVATTAHEGDKGRIPGIDFVDGWMATILASFGMLAPNAKMVPRTAAVDALKATKVVKLSQYLFGARNIFISAREDARSEGMMYRGYGLSRNRTADELVLARQVSDTFMVLSAMLLTSDSYHAAKIVYPELRGLNIATQVEIPGTISSNTEFNVDKESIPLKRESMLFKGASSFLFDTGTSLILYRSFVPPVMIPAPVDTQSSDQNSNNEERTTTMAPPPPPPFPTNNNISAPASNTSNTSADGGKSVGFGFQALNVLGHLDRMAANVMGTTMPDTPVSSAQNTPVKAVAPPPVDDTKDKAETHKLDNTRSWLPIEVTRRAMQGPMVPTIKVIDAASQDAVMVDRYLVEDTPDLMHSHEKSYGKFLDDAIGEAEIEMKDRL